MISGIYLLSRGALMDHYCQYLFISLFLQGISVFPSILSYCTAAAAARMLRVPFAQHKKE